MFEFQWHSAAQQAEPRQGAAAPASASTHLLALGELWAYVVSKLIIQAVVHCARWSARRDRRALARSALAAPLASLPGARCGHGSPSGPGLLRCACQVRLRAALSAPGAGLLRGMGLGWGVDGRPHVKAQSPAKLQAGGACQ